MKLRLNLRSLLRSSFQSCHVKSTASFNTAAFLRTANVDTKFKNVKTLSFGQPTFQSHPEFFRSENDILPGITQGEFQHRRKGVCHITSELVKQENETKEIQHMIIIPSASKKYMTENIPYVFRQNSNFFYLSGSYDIDAFIVLILTPHEERHIMFLGDPNPVNELWDGPKTTPKAAVDYFGFDEAFVTSEFPTFLKQFLHPDRNMLIWCEDEQFIEKYKKDGFFMDGHPIENPRMIFDSLRVIKSSAEINLMAASCKIASESFQQAMAYCGESIHKNGIPPTEHQIWAKIDYECRVRGAERLAYPPVVASGSRANVIHYVFNANKCHPNDMVLVDAGCEFFGYVSDITRTWPVTGKFDNDHHRSLYQMMLELQCDIIKLVKPGITLDQLFRTMGSKLVEGLQDIGIINKSINFKRQSVSDITLHFCPHHVSHYLGMDVHDTPSIERKQTLRPGMILTVEPGIYIRTNSEQNDLLTKVGREFDGIAIRIEDDVLVTEDSHRVLTADCPKTIEDIEKWGNSKRCSR